MLNKVNYLLSILEKKNWRTFSAYLLFSIICPVLDIFSFSMLLHVLNQMLAGTHPDSYMIRLCACLAAVCAGKGLLELYRAHIANRFLYDSTQTLSFRFFDLFLHEDLLDHYKKSPMQAVEIIKKYSDYNRLCQRHNSMLYTGSIFNGTNLPYRPLGHFQYGILNFMDVPALPDNARTYCSLWRSAPQLPHTGKRKYYDFFRRIQRTTHKS